MSAFSGLNTAVSALYAHKRSIDVIGHNIANVNSEGYTRRAVQLQPSVGQKVASRFDADFAWNNLGVDVAGVNRIRDSFLDLKARATLANASSATRLDQVLGAVESVFPEPSDTAIAAQLASFWNSFADAANSAGSIPHRASVLAQASNLVASINQAAGSLETQHLDLTRQLNVTIEQVNTLAEQVAALNSEIRAASVSGMDTGDLADQRDVLIDKLAALTGATTSPSDHNQVNVMLGGSSLVIGSRTERLKAVETGALDPPLDTLQVQRVQLQWERDSYPVAGFGGEIGAMAQGLNDVIPRYMRDLDQIAERLVTTVNAIHTTGQGQDPVNDVNLNFFDPAALTARSLKLSSDVDGQPARLALGALGSGTLDGSVGHQLGAAGALTGGPDALHNAMIGRLGVEAQASSIRSATQQKFVVEAENQRTSVSGVSLDEEMTNLVMSQRAYESAARLMSAIDEMLNTLINRTGAGR